MTALRVKIADGTSSIGTGEKTFRKSPVRIGRGELNDLQLPSRYVSQWHAVIRFDNGSIEYLDLGSTNGSVIGGERLSARETRTLGAAGEVNIGPIALHLESLQEAAPQAEAPAEAGEGTSVDPEAAQKLRLVMSAVQKLTPAYNRYRESWSELRDYLQQILSNAEPGVRDQIVEALYDSCPELRNENEFHQIAAQLGVSLGRNASTSAAASEFARVLGLTGSEALSREDENDLMNKIAEVLKTFCASFVEMRKGLDQFGSELAVETFGEAGPLHQAETGREVLEFLVRGEGNAEERIGALKSAFADMMIHQVALITGMMDGVRGLLHRIGPNAIAQDLVKKPVNLGFLPVKKGVWPFSVLARWKRFEQLHQDLIEEDQEVSSVLFGKDFARSYGEAKRGRTAPVSSDGGQSEG